MFMKLCVSYSYLLITVQAMTYIKFYAFLSRWRYVPWCFSCSWPTMRGKLRLSTGIEGFIEDLNTTTTGSIILGTVLIFIMLSGWLKKKAFYALIYPLDMITICANTSIIVPVNTHAVIILHSFRRRNSIQFSEERAKAKQRKKL